MYRGILAAFGLINFAFGILSAVQPELVAGWIGFELTSPSAFGEMRAVFGGAVTVIGVLFIVAALMPRPTAILGGLALVFASLSVGRIASLVVDGGSFYTAGALLFEGANAAVTAYLWKNPQLLEAEQDLESALQAAEASAEPAAGEPPEDTAGESPAEEIVAGSPTEETAGEGDG